MAPGSPISTTGGHADSHYNPYISESIQPGAVGDGPDELKKMRPHEHQTRRGLH